MITQLLLKFSLFLAIFAIFTELFMKLPLVDFGLLTITGILFLNVIGMTIWLTIHYGPMNILFTWLECRKNKK